MNPTSETKQTFYCGFNAYITHKTSSTTNDRALIILLLRSKLGITNPLFNNY